MLFWRSVVTVIEPMDTSKRPTGMPASTAVHWTGLM